MKHQDEAAKFKASRMAEILEKIVRIVPGIGHYQDKEKIRHWDKELRLQVANRLEAVRRGVEDITRDLAEAGQLKPLKKLNDLNNILDRLRDTIKFASYGYSGIFDPVKIREDLLLKHYEFDLKLSEETEAVEKSLLQLKEAYGSKSDMAAPVNGMIAEIGKLEDFFRARQEFLTAPEKIE